MTHEYDPALSRGIRWNDPDLAIKWPRSPAVIAKHDEKWPNLAHVSLLDLGLAGDVE